MVKDDKNEQLREKTHLRRVSDQVQHKLEKVARGLKLRI